jgi:hypothetical protein
MTAPLKSPTNRILHRLLTWCPAEARVTVDDGVACISLSWPRPPAGDLRGPLAEALLRALVIEAELRRVSLRGADVVLRWRAPGPSPRAIELDLRVAAEAHGVTIAVMAQAALRTAARAAAVPDPVRTELVCQHVGAHAGDLMPILW